MGKPVYIIGHRNPDTDSICSAIGYAHLKRAMGEDVVAARAGKINPETKFVLDYFRMTPPTLINDLFPRVKDVMRRDFVAIHPTDTLQELGQKLKETGVKSVPVVNEDRTLAGIVTVGDLAERYINELEMQDLREAGVNYAGICRSINGNVICGGDLEVPVTGTVKIAAAHVDTMVKMISAGDIVLVGNRENAQQACLDCGAACLIITGGADVSPALLDAAREKNARIILADYDTYTCARLINQSIPVRNVMKTQLAAFKPDELVVDCKRTISGSSYRNYPVVENGRVVGLLNRDQLIVPEREKVILVDHNERSQAVEGIEEAQILEIIDHHRLGGLQTGEPIFIRHEPVGSTATIVANMHWHRGVDLPKSIAGILLAAIISDTILFKSPTATSMDRETANKLSAITGLDLQVFGMNVLQAGSVAGKLSVGEMLSNDLKEFEIGDMVVAIAQISVMDAAPVLAMKAEIQSGMDKLARQENYGMALLMVTDILKEATHLIYWGESVSLLRQAFDANEANGVFFLPGVMSRKKQVVPPMIEASKRQPG
ncbi:MAG TPA: putative manganese-dependent inorganic diphosphatase [Patescibacteria group bacterium]|nr:putative manganese-dependent inorganic diphosphatase [Patescibacteria group bacterium]